MLTHHPRESLVMRGGTPLFAGADDARLEPVRVVAAPTVTHVTYRVLR